MAASHWIFLLLSVASVFPHALQKSLRTKRNLMDLYKIVQCDTHENPLKYIVHGCYCGLGGHGEPLDDVDRCCLVHDCCYGDAERQGCKPKMDHYGWKCEAGEPKCMPEDGSCESKVCKCDKEFAECLKEHSKNTSYEIWPKITCEDTPPQCPPKQ